MSHDARDCVSPYPGTQACGLLANGRHLNEDIYSAAMPRPLVSDCIDRSWCLESPQREGHCRADQR